MEKDIEKIILDSVNNVKLDYAKVYPSIKKTQEEQKRILARKYPNMHELERNEVTKGYQHLSVA